MVYNGRMEFSPGNSEAWKQNEILARKKSIMQKTLELLDAERHMEEALDSRRFALRATGKNSKGEEVMITFDTTHNLHSDVYSLLLWVIPNIEDMKLEDDPLLSIIESTEKNNRVYRVYRLDKTIYDGKDEDPDHVAHTALSAMLKPNDPDRPSDLDEFLASQYEIDEEERKVRYSDNFAETIINAERAEKIIDDFTVTEVTVHKE